MKITTVGIDLAKNVFQVQGIDEYGNAVLKKQLRRYQMAAFFVNLPPCCWRRPKTEPHWLTFASAPTKVLPKATSVEG